MSADGDTGHANRRRFALFVLLLATLGGCGTEAAVGSVERAGERTPEPRPLPTAVDGAIRGVVEAVERAPDRQRLTSGDILVFGDSVARLIVDDLAGLLRDGLVLDAIDCRRLDRGFSGPCGGVPAGRDVPAGVDDLTAVVDELEREGELPSVAVIVLANNSSLRADQLDAAMEVLAGVPVVAWVNARVDGFGRQDTNNQLLVELGDREPRAVLVDWFALSDGRDWLADHVHPNERGQAALGALVVDTLETACRTRPCTSTRAR